MSRESKDFSNLSLILETTGTATLTGGLNLYQAVSHMGNSVHMLRKQ